jgi:ABC-type uncharacterized transport system ATPase subunit
MEEVEALCSNIGILARGQFKCMGTSHYIKNKYGKGFSFTIKCKKTTDSSKRTLTIEKDILKNIPNSILKGFLK